jgi:hypothetical protein
MASIFASARSCRTLSAALAITLFAGIAHAQTTRTATVNFNWTDRTGNLHPLGYAWAQGSYTTLTPVPSFDAGGFYLPANGSGTWTGTSNVPLIETFNFSGTVESRFGANNLEWFRIVNDAGNLYSGTWGPLAASNPAGDTFNLFTDNNTFEGTVLGMGQTFAFGRNYAVNRLGLAMPAFRVRYDAGYTDASFYNGSLANPIIRMNTNTGWCSTDVMLHELGHYVAALAGITASPGGDHTFGGDNITGNGRGNGDVPLGALNGSRLAWGEAFATYFGLTAVRAGNLEAAIPNLSPQDYDNEYARYRSTTSRALDYAQLDFTVSAETPTGRDGNGTNTPGSSSVNRRGEGSEGSVLWAMWDMFDDNNGAFNDPSYGPTNPHLMSDRVSYGDLDMWNRLIRPGNPTTFRAFWGNVTADCNTNAGRAHISGLATNTRAEAVAAMGEILEAAGIACVPTTGNAGHIYNTPRPNLTWIEGNYSNSASFQVLIYSSDWSTLVYGSGLLNDTSPGTIDNYNWTVDVDLANGNYWWVIQNTPAGATVASMTGEANIFNLYWSGARPITVVPTPAAASILGLLALTATRRRR